MSTDHTAFPIEFDPREQRMRGTAVHGNTPFDVPYISQVTDNLWQGGCTRGLLLPPHIEHVVSLYPWEAYDNRHDLASMTSIRLYDDLEGPDTEHIVAIAYWVNACRARGVTLVHCQAGLNRSGMVAAVALMLDGMCSHDAIALLRESRSPAVLCNPSFVTWLHELEHGGDLRICDECDA